jgi:hypothetical protein
VHLDEQASCVQNERRAARAARGKRRHKLRKRAKSVDYDA